MIAALLLAANLAADPIPGIVKGVKTANVERTVTTLVRSNEATEVESRYYIRWYENERLGMGHRL